MTTSRLLDRLLTDHKHIARVLKVLETQMNRYDQDGDLDHRVLDDVIGYITEYPDAVHHPTEDQLFGAVDSVQLSARDREQMRVNLHQHEQMVSETHALAEAIGTIINGGADMTAELRDRVLRYIDFQFAHMATEERELFPLAARHIDTATWSQLDRSLAPGEDPLFDRKSAVYEGLYKTILMETGSS